MRRASRWRRLAREPLLHFAVLGAGLFAVYGARPELRGAAPPRIIVDAARTGHLVAMFQRVWQRGPTAAELDGLIEEHVREEILYREALALGLDQGDVVVRRRLRQKLEFLAEGMTDLADAGGDPIDALQRRLRARYEVEIERAGPIARDRVETVQGPP